MRNRRRRQSEPERAETVNNFRGTVWRLGRALSLQVGRRGDTGHHLDQTHARQTRLSAQHNTALFQIRTARLHLPCVCVCVRLCKNPLYCQGVSEGTFSNRMSPHIHPPAHIRTIRTHTHSLSRYKHIIQSVRVFYKVSMGR